MYTNEPGAAVTLPAPHHILRAHLHLQGFFLLRKGCNCFVDLARGLRQQIGF